MKKSQKNPVITTTDLERFGWGDCSGTPPLGPNYFNLIGKLKKNHLKFKKCLNHITRNAGSAHDCINLCNMHAKVAFHC